MTPFANTGGVLDAHVPNQWTRDVSTVNAPPGSQGPPRDLDGTRDDRVGPRRDDDSSSMNSGGRYDPVRNRWRSTSSLGRRHRTPRFGHSMVGTGRSH
jgi:hypothetical protein